MKLIVNSIFCFIAFFSFSTEGIPQSLTRFVNPYIGTEKGGNIFPGPSLPFGMVKLGPDSKINSNSGFDKDGKIQGFSHVHVSGTGGGPKYGNILMMPVSGDINLSDVSSYRKNEEIKVGYYKTDLTRYDIAAELTTTHSVGFHRYTFNTSGKANIFIDLGSFLGPEWCCGESQEFVGSEIEIVADTLIEGYSRIRNGWNLGEAYTVYFSAVFDTPAASYGIWQGDTLKPDTKAAADNGQRNGAFFTFQADKNQQVNVKVGISFISRGKARQNVLNEANHWSFERVRNEAIQQWEDILSRIQVKGQSDDFKTMFYTALYHSFLQPANRMGENPLWISEKPYYDDFYAIWDTYRATHPLFTLIMPEKQVEIVKALIDIYVHEGFMPDARSGNETGRTQGGSNCDVLIADAFVKGLEGIDYETALGSMIKNAEVAPGDDALMKGRGGLPDYKNLGYVSTDYERAGSRTVEYAYNDYCLYLVAKGLGKQELAAKYLKRSHNWKNLWKDITHQGATGFIMPRNANGEWDEQYQGRRWRGGDQWQTVDFTPTVGGSWQDFFYEGDSWEYSLYVPHDGQGLIEKSGGQSAFLARLDTFFNNGHFNISNEPGFLTPVLYNYAGRPDKSGEVVRKVLSTRYSNSPGGLPGNDDSGSMSAWFVFHAMGFYPNAGQDVYLIAAPHFEEVVIELDDSSKFRIITKQFSEQNKYIKQVYLNGEKWDKSWFRHGDIKGGAVMEIIMDSEPSNWGNSNLPPSVSD